MRRSWRRRTGGRGDAPAAEEAHRQRRRRTGNGGGAPAEAHRQRRTGGGAPAEAHRRRRTGAPTLARMAYLENHTSVLLWVFYRDQREKLR